ncbi:MAG: glycosyl hydrolase [Proteobacteria bacterium]|nr:glycosyl hydrolase [Pseudomonadota bacterium]
MLRTFLILLSAGFLTASPYGAMAQNLRPAQIAVGAWVTTGDRSRLLARVTDLAFASQASGSNVIDVDSDTRYQEMVGFGAAITDSSAWLIQHRMNPQQRRALLQDLFGPSPGIGLSFTRISIGASDFSPRHYSLDDRPPGATDPALAHFSIAATRTELLPVVKSALAINPRLRIMASPWSAPGWMKSTDSLVQGTLRPEAYGAFAEYLRRYISAYAAEGVPIFAITIQNEPHFEPKDYPGMRLDPPARARFIGEYLGPLFERSRIATRILDWDHNWDEVQSPLQVLADPVAAPYVAGVAWHCYAGDVTAQSVVHDAHPGKDTYFTECSGGEWAPEWDKSLKWFVHTLIIGSTRGWAKGVLFWNLALDEHHGPYTGGCRNCRGVVTIDSATGAVTRNVEYYVLAHASRFVRQGARRIASSGSAGALEHVAFRNADDGSIALIVLNPATDAQTFSVRHEGATFEYTLPGGSVVTFVWTAATRSIATRDARP